MKGYVTGVRKVKDSDGWEISEEEFEVEFEPQYEDYPHEFFQFEKPVSDFREFEWSEIKSIANECFKQGLYSKNQFKIAIEAYHRWIALNALNEHLDQEVKPTLKPKTLQ